MQLKIGENYTILDMLKSLKSGDLILSHNEFGVEFMVTCYGEIYGWEYLDGKRYCFSTLDEWEKDSPSEQFIIMDLYKNLDTMCKCQTCERINGL